MGCFVGDGRIVTSSNYAGSPSTEMKNYFTSARDLANVELEEILVYWYLTTLNGLHHEQVEEIVDIPILVYGVGPTSVRKC